MTALAAALRWLGLRGLGVLLAVAGAAAWLASALAGARRRGRREVEAEYLRAEREASHEARTIEDAVRRDGPGAARDWLRGRRAPPDDRG